MPSKSSGPLGKQRRHVVIATCIDAFCPTNSILCLLSSGCPCHRNTHGNYWKVPTHLVPIENTTLRGGGEELRQRIWDGLRPTVREWTGQHLADAALFGVRVYRRGAVLAPHVDRSPLVIGVVLNVDQEETPEEEPWPLEVIAHDGWAHNVTLEPGEMVLYESHSVIHGRPFPLEGSFLANLFVHYEPLGSLDKEPAYTLDIPPYLLPQSVQEAQWRQKNPQGWKARRPRRRSSVS